MKIFNIFIFILLCSAQSFLCLGNGETTFEQIPPELYVNIATQGIISIVNESQDIFTAVEKVAEFLKKSRLISQAFRTQLTQNPAYNDLIKTFKDVMKDKFASDLSDLNQKELNTHLQDSKLSSVFECPLNDPKIRNEIARLIVAGANPNIVMQVFYMEEDIITPLLSRVLNCAIKVPKSLELIPLLLAYGADPNANSKKLDFGFFHEGLKDEKSNIKSIIISPISEISHLDDTNAMQVIKQFIDYKVDLKAKDDRGETLLMSMKNRPIIVNFLRDHGVE